MVGIITKPEERTTNAGDRSDAVRRELEESEGS